MNRTAIAAELAAKNDLEGLFALAKKRKWVRQEEEGRIVHLDAGTGLCRRASDGEWLILYYLRPTDDRSCGACEVDAAKAVELLKRATLGKS
jgi:hypothetical protein